MATILLAGDVGGTKTALAIFSLEETSLRPLAEASFPSARYPTFDSLVREFLSDIRLPVEAASFGVAGPVLRGRARITNLPWVIDEGELARSLGLRSVQLLNDVEAIANFVPSLAPPDLHTLNEGETDLEGNIAVIAPGTGLGEAFLTWEGSQYRAHASEGGHADFAPADSTQLELLDFLMERFGHVSVERVCSGRGLTNIYDFYHKDVEPSGEGSDERLRISEAEDPMPLIVANALEKETKCQFCVSTLRMFVSILGAEAGNLALKVLATRGVFLGGGIPVRILPALKDERFLRAFQGKGRMSELLTGIPVRVILSPRAALLGAARLGLESMKARGTGEG